MPVSSFYSLPQRVFLDSSILQRFYGYGGFIWENEPIPSNDAILRVHKGIEDLTALKNILHVHQRALWEFVISKNALAEVAAKYEKGYLLYSLDVFDYSSICIEESDISLRHSINTDEKVKLLCNNLSDGDLQLVLDAYILACDAFLTCDHRLEKNKDMVQRHLQILVMSPVTYWEIISPWARLFC